MKKLTNSFPTMALAFLIVTVPACTVLDKVQEKSSEKISELVIKYCAETNETFRLRLREEINLKMAGQATIAVECLPSTGEVVNGYREHIASVSNWGRHANLFYRLSPVATKRKAETFRNESVRWRQQIVNNKVKYS